VRIKWVIGKKTNYFTTAAWTLLAVIDFVQGEWYVGLLEIIIALSCLTDAFRGDEVTAFDFKIGKGVK
jgi:hypothetical protein